MSDRGALGVAALPREGALVTEAGTVAVIHFVYHVCVTSGRVDECGDHHPVGAGGRDTHVLVESILEGVSNVPGRAPSNGLRAHGTERIGWRN